MKHFSRIFLIVFTLMPGHIYSMEFPFYKIFTQSWAKLIVFKNSIFGYNKLPEKQNVGSDVYSNTEYIQPQAAEKKTNLFGIASLLFSPFSWLKKFSFLWPFRPTNKEEFVQVNNHQSQNNLVPSAPPEDNLQIIPFIDLKKKAEEVPDFPLMEKEKLYDFVELEDGNKIVESEITFNTELLRDSDYSIEGRDFNFLLDEVLKSQDKLLNAVNWIDNSPYRSEDLKNCDLFAPFVQGLRVHENTRIVLLGSSHGDWKSRNQSLKDEFDDNGYIKDKNAKILLLGNVAEKGFAATELLYYFLVLRLKNPDNFFLVRGKYDDISINEALGFSADLKKKYSVEFYEKTLKKKIQRIYNTFPVALFVASGNSALCGCNGFMDPRYNPQRLIAALYNNTNNISNLFERYPIESDRILGKNISLSKNQPLVQEFGKATSFKDIDFLWSFSWSLISREQVPNNFVLMSSQECGLYFQQRLQHLFWQKNIADRIRQDWNDGLCTVEWIFCSNVQDPQEFKHRGPSKSNNNKTFQLLYGEFGVAECFSDNLLQNGNLKPGTYVNILSAPNNAYGVSSREYPGFNYDTVVEVRTGSSRDDWIIKSKNYKAFSMPESSDYKGGLGFDLPTYMNDKGEFVCLKDK